MKRALTSECAANPRKKRSNAKRFRLTRKQLEEIIADPNKWVPDSIAELITEIPRGTLRRYRHEGRGPRYVKSGASVRYRVEWLLEFLAQHTVETRESVQGEGMSR
jgi:hypothetical protein